jgi:hypothetical protein
VYTDFNFIGDAVFEKRECRRKKKLLELERNLGVGDQWRRKAEVDWILTLRQEEATTNHTLLNHMVNLETSGDKVNHIISLSAPVI